MVYELRLRSPLAFLVVIVAAGLSCLGVLSVVVGDGSIALFAGACAAWAALAIVLWARTTVRIYERTLVLRRWLRTTRYPLARIEAVARVSDSFATRGMVFRSLEIREGDFVLLRLSEGREGRERFDEVSLAFERSLRQFASERESHGGIGQGRVPSGG